METEFLIYSPAAYTTGVNHAQLLNSALKQYLQTILNQYSVKKKINRFPQKGFTPVNQCELL